MQAILTRILPALSRRGPRLGGLLAPVEAPASQISTASVLPMGERLAALGVLVVLVVTILA